MKFVFAKIILFLLWVNCKSQSMSAISYHKSAIINIHKSDAGPYYADGPADLGLAEHLYFKGGGYTFSYLLDGQGYCLIQLISGKIEYLNALIKIFQEKYIKVSDTEWVDYSHGQYDGIISYRIVKMDKENFLVRIMDKETSDLLN